MIKVFVSGCYDILHAGHIRWFKEARKFGDSLTVCFASDEVYRAWKGREPALPEASRRAILEELRCVDRVVMSTNRGGSIAFDFAYEFMKLRPNVLVIADDDTFLEKKRAFCAEVSGAGGTVELVTVPRQPSDAESTTAIRARMAKT